MFKRSLFIFRRDLRLRDNTGLLAAMNNSASVIPLFIIDPTLLNRYDAVYRKTFLAQSLYDLDQEVRKHGGSLAVQEGNPPQLLAQLFQQADIDAVFVNRDYTPVSRARDRKLKAVCESAGVVFEQYGDQLLNEPEQVTKSDGSPYLVFTPYYRKAREYLIHPPDQCERWHFETTVDSDLRDSSLASYLERSLSFQAGRTGAVKALSGLADLAHYDETRDLPGTDGTSRLSGHLRFGTCSIREVFHTLQQSLPEPETLQRQLYWRDFYHHIGHHFPHVYRRAFRPKYDDLQWDENPEALESWCQGKTGFPIVDAGMRELAATGFMHNRVRMITASFLTKNLHIDWRQGESHFARLLIDFDPALNNGNWQWSASTGCDAQPYFRVFNPWRQQRRFDKDCSYIKQWIPELADRSAKEIHALEKTGNFYLPQITDLRRSAEESKHRFKKLSSPH